MKGCFRKSLTCAHLLVVGALSLSPGFGASFNTPFEPKVSIIRSNTGIVRVTYEGQTNFQYVLRASTNLPNWFDLTTNVASTTQTFFTDKAATNSPKRFYSGVAYKSSMFYNVQAAGDEAGPFLLYVRTNNSAILLGFSTARNIGESRSDLNFDQNGVCCGRLLSFASGCLTNLPTRVLGTYTNTTNSIGRFIGPAQSNSGIFRKAAGLYSGAYDGSCAGTVQALVSADGIIAVYFSDATGTFTDGWMGVLNSNGATAGGNPVPGHVGISATLNSASFTISGTYQLGCPDHAGSGNLHLSIVEHAY